MFDVITIGSVTVDAFTYTDKRFVKGRYYSFPIGSKLLVKGLDFEVGGGGTNTGVAFARLGLKTAFLGKIGKGTNSQRVLNLLKREKVDCSLVCRENARTGFSVVLDAKGVDRTILVFKGSNNNLMVRDVRFNRLKTKWFYFSSMMEQSFKTQQKIADFAVKKGIKIAYNPSGYLIGQNKNAVKRMLKKVEILVLNKQEAGELINGKGINWLLKGLRRAGPEIVVITDGAKGVHSFDGEYVCTIRPHKVKVEETTGAGDAFAASFLAGIIKKRDICFALQIGLANAESVIQYLGAKNRLLRWKEAVRIIKKRPGKIVCRKV